VSFYDEYEPLRNYMRRFDLLPSLVDVWCYSLHVMEGQPLPAGYAIGYGTGKSTLTLTPLRQHIYPWDLDILTKEIVLNAGSGGDRSLKRWNDLAVALNHIRRLDDAAYAQGGEHADILLELHRTRTDNFRCR
jgi:hypothetical protein